MYWLITKDADNEETTAKLKNVAVSILITFFMFLMNNMYRMQRNMIREIFQHTTCQL